MQAANPIQPATPDSANTPRHIAIIMDGNSRWAKANGKPVREGHRKGSDALKKLVENCRGRGIEVMTVYAFSSENWNRPQEEISDLMELLRYYLRHEVKSLHKNGVRLRFIGNRAMLSEDIQKELVRTEEMTQANTAMTLVIALSYGSRDEMVQACRQMAQQAVEGALKPEAITEDKISEALYTADIPEPDLLIRTAGEQRLSNFLLWQLAYAELYFCDVLWPDFTIEHLLQAIESYAQRERRFGAR